MIQFFMMDIGMALPEVFLSAIGLFLLLVGVFLGNGFSRTLTRLTIFALLLSLGMLYNLPGHIIFAFNELFVSHSFIIAAKLLLISGTVLALFLLLGRDAAHKEEARFELPILMLLATIGMMVMVSANNFITLYMGLELQSLALYVLAASQRDDAKSSEAGLKYFMLGALASGVMLYGISLIYGFAGTLQFDALAVQSAMPVAVLVGLILVIVALCFKISAVPFHMWSPDVYQGAPTVVTAFFATAPKVAAIALLVRLLLEPFGHAVLQWQQVITVIAALSMTVGALGALRQSNIKRLLAYSGIGHVGYLLMGLASASAAGIQAMGIYLAIYITMSAGAFACVLMMKRQGVYTEEIADLAGLAKSRPLMAIALLVLMLSMAGIPPLAGFFGKFYIFLAALEAKLYGLAIIGVVTSVIGAFYYLKVVKVMYFDEPKTALDPEKTYALRGVSAVATLFNIGFFIFPAPLVGAAATAVQILFR